MNPAPRIIAFLALAAGIAVGLLLWNRHTSTPANPAGGSRDIPPASGPAAPQVPPTPEVAPHAPPTDAVRSFLETFVAERQPPNGFPLGARILECRQGGADLTVVFSRELLAKVREPDVAFFDDIQIGIFNGLFPVAPEIRNLFVLIEDEDGVPHELNHYLKK